MKSVTATLKSLYQETQTPGNCQSDGVLAALEAMLQAYAPHHQASVDHRGSEEGLHSAVRAARQALKKCESSKATHYRVSWQDRQYKTQEKLFKGPDSEENRKKADAFAKKLEAKDDSDKYGNIRGRVSVKPV